MIFSLAHQAIMKLLILTLLAFAAAEKFSYDGYKVYNVYCETEEQKQIILNLSSELDVWKHDRKLGEASHVMVEPERQYWFIQILEEAGIRYDIKIEDVQPMVEESYASVSKDFDLNSFNTLEDIYNEMFLMADDCNALGLDCEVRTAGQSVEGREMLVLVVKKDASNTDTMGIWVDTTIHAREWVATSMGVNLMDRISRHYHDNPEVTEVVDKFNWYIMPVLNPDGYKFTHDDTRLWRKNRGPTSNSNCPGIDLNRNFDYDWNTVGSSENPCSETYHGPSAASEPETQHVQDVSALLVQEEFLVSWVSAHTYGEYWLHSYGGKEDGDDSKPCKRSEVHDDLYITAERTVHAIEAANDNDHVWTYGSICEAIYPAAGGTVDYLHGTSKVKYSYTPELRGNGFIVPESEIQPAFEEFWVALETQVHSMYAIENDLEWQPPK